MRTKTVTIYTAAELREHHPRGFERAHDRHCRWLGEDPPWLAEHRESTEAALAAIGDDPPDIEGPRRVMAWLENHVLGPLRIPWTGKRRWEVSRYGSSYRPGCVEPCPWTGYCLDDDLLDCMREGAREGRSPCDIKRDVAQRAEMRWDSEMEYTSSAEAFIGEAEVNDWEFHADGSMA